MRITFIAKTYERLTIYEKEVIRKKWKLVLKCSITTANIENTFFLYKQLVYKQPVLGPWKNVATFEAQKSPVVSIMLFSTVFWSNLPKFMVL